MTLAILLVALAAAPLEPLQEDPAVACRASCARHVPASQMPRVCVECIRRRDPAAWTFAYRGRVRIPESVVKSALGDPLWEVRWGALRARARAQRKDEAEVLYAWLRSQTDPEARVDACRVAVGAAALVEGRVLEAAQKGCKPVRQQVRDALEAELYLPRAAAQEEALRKLMLFLGEGPGRVILNAIQDRPPGLDEVPALLLVRVATRELPVGKLLLADADAGSQPEMNRLLSVYARQIDGLRPQLTAPEVEKRRDAVRALALFMPMTQPELERALADVDGSVRLAAVSAIAEANGHSLHQELAVRAKDWPRSDEPVESQVRWVKLVGQVKERGCGKRLLSLVNDERLAAEVRGAALGALGRCDEGNVLAHVAEGLRSDAPAIRAGAVRALAEQPGQRGSSELVKRALADEAPEVVAEALRTVGGQSLHGGRDRALPMLDHEAPQVRLAAAEILAEHARATHLPAMRDRLAIEPEPAIRVQLVRGLARLGGPLATAALAEVESKDPDAFVRKSAADGLRGMLR